MYRDMVLIWNISFLMIRYRFYDVEFIFDIFKLVKNLRLLVLGKIYCDFFVKRLEIKWYLMVYYFVYRLVFLFIFIREVFCYENEWDLI